MKPARVYKKTNPNWTRDYKPENKTGLMQPSKEQLKEGKCRRRIEDLKEGLRLDREAFNEVWED